MLRPVKVLRRALVPLCQIHHALALENLADQSALDFLTVATVTLRRPASSVHTGPGKRLAQPLYRPPN